MSLSALGGGDLLLLVRAREGFSSTFLSLQLT
jgi:hypothetical protein